MTKTKTLSPLNPSSKTLNYPRIVGGDVYTAGLAELYHPVQKSACRLMSCVCLGAINESSLPKP